MSTRVLTKAGIPVRGDQEATTSGGGEKAAAKKSEEQREVMGKYLLVTSKDTKMGEGTSSICYKGTIKETGEEIGIKIYKVGEPNRGTLLNTVRQEGDK